MKEVTQYAFFIGLLFSALSIILLLSSSVPGVTLAEGDNASLLIVDGTSEFGQGYYDPVCTSGVANLWTEGNGVTAASSCWLNITGESPSYSYQGHTLMNNGSVPVSVSINTTLSSAESLFCLFNVCPSTSASVQTKMVNKEAGACTATANTTWVILLSHDGAIQNQQYTLCGTLDFVEASNEIYIDFNMTIPRDVSQGMKTLVITYIATQT